MKPSDQLCPGPNTVAAGPAEEVWESALVTVQANVSSARSSGPMLAETVTW